MKRLLIVCLGMMSAIGCKTAMMKTRLPVYEVPYKVAVLPFYGEDPYGQQLTNALIDRLVNAGYCVIERSSLPQIFQEQAFQYTGRVDPFSSVQIGKIKGVDFLVMGSIETKDSVSLGNWLLGDGIPVSRIESVQTRWVSVQSGRIVASYSFHNGGNGSIEKMAQAIMAGLQQRAVKTISMEANKDVAERMDRSWNENAVFQAAVR